MINITQGDYAVLNLTAQDGNGNPVNLTGATFSTQIVGTNGVVVTFGNSQHAIVNAALGQYSLTLAQADTSNCGIGANKDILTTISQSGNPVTYRGRILTVNPPVPLQ
jgi:hypothetical protein